MVEAFRFGIAVGAASCLTAENGVSCARASDTNECRNLGMSTTEPLHVISILQRPVSSESKASHAGQSAIESIRVGARSTKLLVGFGRRWVAIGQS